MKQLKILTFNLRVENSVDGENCFSSRLPGIMNCIKRENADLIAFQEMSDNMYRKMFEKMTELGYTVSGCGREADGTGERSAVAYKSEMFEPVFCKTIWLSPTPEVPGSRYIGYQSEYPRTFTHIRLIPHGCTKEVDFICLHTDHPDEYTCRLLEFAQVLQYMSANCKNIILAGDFNCQPFHDDYIFFRNNSKYLTDITEGLPGTYHDYERLDEFRKVDYILTNLSVGDINMQIKTTLLLQKTEH